MPISAYTHQMLDPTDARLRGLCGRDANDVVADANDVFEDAALVDVTDAVVVVDVCINVEVTGAAWSLTSAGVSK